MGNHLKWGSLLQETTRAGQIPPGRAAEAAECVGAEHRADQRRAGDAPGDAQAMVKPGMNQLWRPKISMVYQVINQRSWRS